MKAKTLFMVVALNAQLAQASWLWGGSDGEDVDAKQEGEYDPYDPKDNSDLAFLERLGTLGSWFDGIEGFFSGRGKEDSHKQWSSPIVVGDVIEHPSEIREVLSGARQEPDLSSNPSLHRAKSNEFNYTDSISDVGTPTVSKDLRGIDATELDPTRLSSADTSVDAHIESADAADDLSVTTTEHSDHTDIESEDLDTEDRLTRRASDQTLPYDSLASVSPNTFETQSTDTIPVEEDAKQQLSTKAFSGGQRKIRHLEPRVFTEAETTAAIQVSLSPVANLQAELQKLCLPDPLFAQITFRNTKEALAASPLPRHSPLPDGLLDGFKNELIKGKSWWQLEELCKSGSERYVNIRNELMRAFPFTLGFFPHLVPESKKLMQQLELMLSLLVLLFPQLKEAPALTKADIAALIHLFVVAHRDLNASVFRPLIQPFADINLSHIESLKDLKEYADAGKPYLAEACGGLSFLSKKPSE
jgi:hypothetical protein